MDIISNEFLNKYKDKQPNWGFQGLGYVVYHRTYSRPMSNGKMEEWADTIARCINGAQTIGADYTKEEAEKLYDYIFNLKCSFAGRMLWQLGTDGIAKYKANSMLNCWFCQINTLEAFCFLFENLMLGGGVGFSVRREDVHELPKIKEHVRVAHLATKDADFIVPDSREGWVNLLRKVLKAYYETGKSFTYSTILVRGKGEPIKGFGGTASGPTILIEGIDKIVKIFKSRAGKKLRSIDALDVCNIIGSIVVAGNIRRSAEISLGDPDDYLFIRAKRWDVDNIPNHRAMSNNTIYADDYSCISNDIWAGFEGNGECYGFFNLPLSQKFGRLGDKIKDNVQGLNPCQPENALILDNDKLVTISEKAQTFRSWCVGKKETIELRCNNGMILEFTPNHKLMLEDGTFCEAKDTINKNLKWGLGERTSTLISEKEILRGFLFGDGYLCGKKEGISVKISSKETEVCELLEKNKFKKQLSGAYYIKRDKNKYDFLEHRVYNRLLPNDILFGDSNTVASFLKGLFEANGSCNTNNQISLKSTCKEMLQKVQLLLASFGVQSWVVTNKAAKIQWANGIYLSKESYNLQIAGTNSYIFKEKIGFYSNTKNNKIKKSNKKYNGKLKVIEIRQGKNCDVWDYTMYNKPNYNFCQGVIASNCGEITLSNWECCNLTDIFLNNISSKEELIDCAKLLYKTQKAIGAMDFLHDETTRIVHKNMRIGIGITGICQSLNKLEWLSDCYEAVRKFDIEWSKKKNLNPSIKITTIKPSGSLSLLAGATPGTHAAFSTYYIRRIRMMSTDPLVDICKKLGYKVDFVENFDSTLDRGTVVVEFPCYAGKDTTTAKELTAVKQMELVKKLQTIWADNSVSCTVYYKLEELPEIKKWLKENYESDIKSISFLLHKDSGFKQMPYEEISKEQYDTLIQNIKPITNEIITGSDIELEECTKGSCPIK